VVHKIAYTLSGPLDLEGMGQSAPTSSFSSVFTYYELEVIQGKRRFKHIIKFRAHFAFFSKYIILILSGIYLETMSTTPFR